jgi:hypothetical protein
MINLIQKLTRFWTGSRAYVESRRWFITRGAVGLTALTFTTTALKCGVSKEKAVKVAGFVIELTKESVPLFDLLGAHDLATAVNEKVIPALEKLKNALANADIPASDSALTTVRTALRAVGDALLNLPASARRTTIIGILGSVNYLLLTVEAFVKSETDTSVAKSGALTAVSPESSLDKAILKAYEVTRQ